MLTCAAFFPADNNEKVKRSVAKDSSDDFLRASQEKTRIVYKMARTKSRDARFFLVQHTKTGKIYQNGKNIPKREKYTK
jgi:hypothetical protein